MAGDRIKLSPQELRTSATKYTDGSQQVQDILQKLQSEQDTIQGNWEGSGFDSFNDQFTALKPKVSEFAELLDQINKQLNEVATIVEETDQNISSAIGRGL
ncbi:type VII secretion protein EsxA [Enterococcus ureilyticus]|uniref:ESAT-6-like protein n=1 Tax=Enterococcus ureilyticus TaxID=1131292 RepID=A0A1E5HCK5_9ENTE|nr:WXG100 family type VII secretion target [Enterococcus ureilyticus]MBM7690366.1 WXG100 family type VII secretion target [Enterococcus ureilyticus]MBO0447527.1 WXG100 family type VII secretion target [Enterococcus ureilyticus]OEG22566.1 type VII secretion protein EsxA [Enterococcus ureilyticus]